MLTKLKAWLKKWWEVETCRHEFTTWEDIGYRFKRKCTKCGFIQKTEQY